MRISDWSSDVCSSYRNPPSAPAHNPALRIIAADRDGADRALGDIVVDLRDAVIDVAGERIPTLAAIGKRLRHRRLGRQTTQGVVDRAAKRIDLRPGLPLSLSAPDIGRLGAPHLFDPVEPGDPIGRASCREKGWHGV